MTTEFPPPLLDCHNLLVMRGQKIVLDEFSLRIGPDEYVAILGPNGCGKSTLIKTITRECYPVVRDDSWMKLPGHEGWDVFKLREHMGIVSNDLMLSVTGEASGRDVVLSGFFSSTAIWPNHTVDPEKIRLADAALAELKISHLANRPVCQMSSGEGRRVLIARALVHKPRALLFDEHEPIEVETTLILDCSKAKKGETITCQYLKWSGLMMPMLPKREAFPGVARVP